VIVMWDRSVWIEKSGWGSLVSGVGDNDGVVNRQLKE
jgi:hypothetical protein